MSKRERQRQPDRLDEDGGDETSGVGGGGLVGLLVFSVCCVTFEFCD